MIDAVGTEAHGSAAAALVQNASAMLPRKHRAARSPNGSASTGSPPSTPPSTWCAAAAPSRCRGVYGGMADPMPLLTLFDKQIQMRMGQANVRRWSDDILPYLTDEDPLGVDDFATHRVPLSDAPHAYEMFQRKQDGAVKVLMQP